MTSVDGGMAPPIMRGSAAVLLEDLLAALDRLYQAASGPAAWPEAIAAVPTSLSNMGGCAGDGEGVERLAG